VRDLAASIGAMMLATRVGAGIAAEIGSMVVTEQVDALRMSGVDPVDYLIVPRFIASLLMTGVLIAGRALRELRSRAARRRTSSSTCSPHLPRRVAARPGDVIIGVAKCVAYGAAIPVVSGWCGLTTRAAARAWAGPPRARW
jgi:phospholipid/cholesterol/gamma-HCH transport system permease protein